MSQCKLISGRVIEKELKEAFELLYEMAADKTVAKTHRHAAVQTIKGFIKNIRVGKLVKTHKYSPAMKRVATKYERMLNSKKLSI